MTTTHQHPCSAALLSSSVSTSVRPSPVYDAPQEPLRRICGVTSMGREQFLHPREECRQANVLQDASFSLSSPTLVRVQVFHHSDGKDGADGADTYFAAREFDGLLGHPVLLHLPRRWASTLRAATKASTHFGRSKWAARAQEVACSGTRPRPTMGASRSRSASAWTL